MRSKLLFLALSVAVAAGCSRQTLRTDQQIIGNEVIPVMVPTGGDVEVPNYGKETYLAIGALAGIKPAVANGVADMHVFEKGVTLVGLKLNIQPAEGGAYVAWAENTATKERVRLGELQNPSGDVRHALNATMDKDLRAFTRIVVTSGSDVPQAEALLKERAR
jgi:hypothetical protein